MKSKKFIIIFVCIFSLIFGAIFFDTHYAVIDKKIYKNDIKDLSVYSLNDSDIKNINKCTEIEKLYLSYVSENSVSKLGNFSNLNHLMILSSEISSSDSEKISTFDNLKDLIIGVDCTIDFKGFNSDTLSFLGLNLESKAINFEALSECTSLKEIYILKSIISDCIDNNYVMKDSSVFAS
ncbi:MAG: hypothetical protein NC040_00245, partial [Muribaculaceae bacterium]|nr:hypothetical protein [Muribaculaceae bacterium]